MEKWHTYCTRIDSVYPPVKSYSHPKSSYFMGKSTINIYVNNHFQQLCQLCQSSPEDLISDSGDSKHRSPLLRCGGLRPRTARWELQNPKLHMNNILYLYLYIYIYFPEGQVDPNYSLRFLGLYKKILHGSSVSIWLVDCFNPIFHSCSCFILWMVAKSCVSSQVVYPIIGFLPSQVQDFLTSPIHTLNFRTTYLIIFRCF